MITREGVIGLFILIPVMFGLAYVGGNRTYLVTIPFILGWIAFCRHPRRRVPLDPDGWVAPADGRVVAVGSTLDGRVYVGIFMNVWNVHVNRAPREGRIVSVLHQKGRFLPAFHHRAVRVNEQIHTVVETDRGSYRVIQIAGILARRIRFWKAPDVLLRRGEPFGMILLGSRVDVILPPGVTVAVKPGMKTRAGETILARGNHAK